MTLDSLKDDFQQQWHTKNDVPGGYNYTGFGSAKMDGLIDSIRVTMDEGKEMKCIRGSKKNCTKKPQQYFYLHP
ncbi:MAG: hypothetical protein R2769_06890 [Saprospiraceae bacterium]